MSQYLVSEEAVKDALGIDTFRNISKDKIMEFISAIPNMDKEVAIKIINQFPAYAETAMNMVSTLDTMCDKALKENSESQAESIIAYKKILSDLGEVLKKDSISPEERASIADRMITIADRIAAKDSENKEFLNDTLKRNMSLIGGALLLGAVILGVNVKDVKIPFLKK